MATIYKLKPGQRSLKNRFWTKATKWKFAFLTSLLINIVLTKLYFNK